jgi:phage protein D
MDLAALSVDYGGFYAPSFRLLVGGRDLVRTELVAVSQVEADLVLGGAARFSFTVVDSYSLEQHAFITGLGRPLLDLLAFGTEVQVFMGYGDDSKAPVLMAGVITEISTDFPEAGTPELVIAGYDHAFPLTNGKSSRTWANTRDSDAVLEIAQFHNLGAQIDQTAEQHPQIEQNQESDFEFIKKLAERNHYEVYVDQHGTLRFAKPRDKDDGVVILAWGRGLLSFKPEANLAGQVTAVEVYGWDPKRKEKIVGRAQAGQESGHEAQRRSAGERFGAIVRDSRKQPVLRLRQPVFTQAEANSRAQAVLNERAKQFLTGEAETVGLPQIRPDTNVTLENLGKPFSKTYYVQQATHKIDGNGYRTRFKIKETTL